MEKRVDLSVILSFIIANLMPVRGFDLSTISLIAANLVPIFGMLFFKWSIFSILFFYWFESAVIGFFTVIKMLISSGKESQKSKMLLIIFFIFHFGIFMLVHLSFIMVFLILTPSSHDSWSLSKLISNVLFPILALFISHGISFFVNFIGKKEYQKTSIGLLMAAPYTRVILMHITIILGMFIIMITGIPILVAVFFVALKTIIDLISHNLEHKKIQEIKV
jgi:hypothetical protein